jgi:predicted AlkP superfamily phosphohydrolase/phosphomutase
VSRVLVIGLDCAAPELVFDRLAPDLPTIGKLRSGGLWGTLESCHPPITVPAWMVMATSKDPGRLGLYGFRHRKGFSYTDGWIATSGSVREPAVWDIIGRAGKRSCLVGIPPSYPPKPVPGWLVSCFITPDASRPYTYPADLKPEIEAATGGYRFDVEFRTEDRGRLLSDLYDMTERHFTALRHLATTRPWDLLWFVEIGVDRLHHAFWKFYDPAHPKYEPGNRYEQVIPDYYRFVDAQIATLLERVPDDTVVLVVSDHGAKAMRGAFCINQWLADEGYLVFDQPPGPGVSLEAARVDWAKSTAWGWGGYYARIFFNVQGREPQGVIPADRVPAERSRLADRLRRIRDPGGRLMDTRTWTPDELYPVARGDTPDLLVYLDDLYWRSAGTVGWPSVYLEENDTGPDDAVHAQRGIFILHDPRRSSGGRLDGLRILDVAPTLLEILGVPQPADLMGHPLDARV